MPDNKFKPLYTDKQWKLVYELWCLGYTMAELAEWLSVCPGTISKNFLRLGFRLSERMPLSEYNKRFNELGDSDV